MRLLLLVALAGVLLLPGVAGAQDGGPLLPPSANVGNERPMPPEVEATINRLTDEAVTRADHARARIARHHGRHLAGAFAKAAHWSYTWPVISANLVDTNEDRACGWGVSQYCYGDSKRNVFHNWSGDHYVTHEAIWAQYQYCLPGCDYADSCSAVVRTVDHNDGGRVNIVRNWYWTHKESSCNLDGPIAVVP